MLHIKFTSRAFDKLITQCVVITTFSDLRPFKGNAALLDWRLNGRLSQIMIKNRFEGNFGEMLLLPAEGRIKSHEIIVLGLGVKNDFHESHVNKFVTFLLETIAQKKVSDFLVCLSDVIADRFEWRNTVRLLVSKLHDFPVIENIQLCEPEDCVRDAKKRHMDFGMNVEVSFETNSA